MPDGGPPVDIPKPPAPKPGPAVAPQPDLPAVTGADIVAAAVGQAVSGGQMSAVGDQRASAPAASSESAVSASSNQPVKTEETPESMDAKDRNEASSHEGQTLSIPEQGPELSDKERRKVEAEMTEIQNDAAKKINMSIARPMLEMQMTEGDPTTRILQASQKMRDEGAEHGDLQLMAAGFDIPIAQLRHSVRQMLYKQGEYQQAGQSLMAIRARQEAERLQQQIVELVDQRKKSPAADQQNQVISFAQAVGADEQQLEDPMGFFGAKIQLAITDRNERENLLARLRTANPTYADFMEKTLNDFNRSERIKKLGEGSKKAATMFSLFAFLMAWIASQSNRGGQGMGGGH